MRRRLALAMVLAALIPLGLATKFYAGPAAAWMRGSAGGVLYVMFFVLLITCFRPTPRTLGWATVGVFVATCLLEVTQRWRPPVLEAIRATFLGRSLIGSTFSWMDFPHYLAGALLGWLIGRQLVRTAEPQHGKRR